MSFEANRGQTDERVKFFSRGSGYVVFLMPREVVVSIGLKDPAVLRMRLVGQNKKPRIEGLDPLAGTTHYLLGADARGWRKDVPSYAKVRYGGVYPGIDVVYYGNGRQLEYDFVVAPQADPNEIELSFEGVKRISVDGRGDLVLKTSTGEIRQHKPVVYQEVDGRRTPIEGAYVVTAKRRVGFRIAGYDKSKPLIIDPVLIYSSYFGGAATGSVGDQGIGITVDAVGNAYVTGHTGSANFPIGDAAQAAIGGGMDAFVLKLNPSGTAIVFSTFFGGSGSDEGHSIALDRAGNIVVAGHTSSPNFPTTNAAQRNRGGEEDAFVLKLNNSGTGILFSTYLGGSADDRAIGVAVDAAGAAYVAGLTSSNNFPVANAFQPANGGGLADVFITKVSASGSMVYSTYVGGRGHEQAYGVAVDQEGDAYAVGFTTSINFPVMNNAQSALIGGPDDAFLLKLNPAGNALVYSTFFGGSGSDNAVRVAVDDLGSAHVTGITSSPDFPVTANAVQVLNSGNFDVFVTKFTPDAQDVVYSTFLGGFGTESGAGIALDREGNTYVAGFTTSFEFPVVNALQGFNNGDRDAFVAKLTPDGTLMLYSTYLGGFDIDGAIGVAVDPAGDVYLTGFSTSTDFPTANAFQAENAGGLDAFIAKINADDIKTSSEFRVPRHGGDSVQTSGLSRDPTFGYASAEAAEDVPRPTGLAILDLRQVGVAVTEVGVPAPREIKDGRFFVEVNSQLRPVLSIANPTDEEVTVDFFLTDREGTASNFATETIPPRGHFSRFVTDDPLFIPSGASGALTFSTSAPLPATAFRTLTNERSELTLSLSSIADLNRVPSGPLVIPHFVDGAGWTTQIFLINTGEERLNGEIRFYSSGSETEPGQPVEVGLLEGTASVFEYDIPPRGFNQFLTIGLTEELVSGWIHIVPFSGFSTPHASAVLSFNDPTFAATVTHTLMEGQTPGSKFRLYAEAIRDFNAAEGLSTQTAFSLANSSEAPATVRLELTKFDGTPSGHSGTLVVPANGQVAMFLNQAPGFENLAAPFRGVLRVTTDSPSGIAVAGLRAMYNERGIFLLTTTGPIVEDSGSGSTLIFPHIADGGGFGTEFILLGGPDGQASHGIIRWVDTDGQPIHLTVRRQILR